MNLTELTQVLKKARPILESIRKEGQPHREYSVRLSECDWEQVFQCVSWIGCLDPKLGKIQSEIALQMDQADKVPF